MVWLVVASLAGFGIGLLWTALRSGLDAEDRRALAWCALPVVLLLVFFGGLYFEKALETAVYGACAGALSWLGGKWMLRLREARRR
jgi:hypothetical protein